MNLIKQEKIHSKKRVGAKHLIRILARITKSDKNYSKIKTIEGYLIEENRFELVNWLNETLKVHHHFDLQNFSNWKDRKSNKFLWGS